MKVTGLGVVFFRAKDSEALAAWYLKHLGVFGMDEKYQPWQQQKGPTVFLPFAADTDYFGSAQQQFMLNFRVEHNTRLQELHEMPFGTCGQFYDGYGTQWIFRSGKS